MNALWDSMLSLVLLRSLIRGFEVLFLAMLRAVDVKEPSLEKPAVVGMKLGPFRGRRRATIGAVDGVGKARILGHCEILDRASSDLSKRV